MTVIARFPALAAGYESFYVRAVDPGRPRSVWLRHTVHLEAGRPALGSIWVTLFDRDAPAPVAHKLTVARPRPEPWLSVGDSAFGPAGVRGGAGPAGAASYDLRFDDGGAEPLRHLPAAWMYRAPLPRTKLESPLPQARVTGRATVRGTTFELDEWPGMVGHNWGSEHAERWIWLHGTAFDGDPSSWLDLSIARVRIGRATTPWIAAGALCLGGRRTRLRGPARVSEDPLSVDASLRGLRVSARSPREHAVVWRYGAHHHTTNCSVAELSVEAGGRRLHTPHGGVYELGTREQPAGLPVQPFPDP